MKTYPYMYLGMVINNNDPEYRGRIQVFVPHIMPTLYEDWNQTGEDIQINCVGDNMPQGLTSQIVDKLKLILPWAEAASPIVGQGISGGTRSSQGGSSNQSPGGQNSGGQNSGGQSSGQDPTGQDPGKGNTFDQTPTSQPTGSLPPGDKCDIPIEAGVNVKDLKPGFVERLNGLFREAIALGYKVTCSSGYRSPEKQKALYEADMQKKWRKAFRICCSSRRF